jgi:PTH1 family peptidyl-tRNA hydrolase
MKFIIGLGNPGGEYDGTKHNIGFQVVEEIAKEHGIDIDKEVHSSFMGKGKIDGEGVVFFLPQTYMNLSGKAVADLFEEQVERPEDVIVICDDINLKLGRIRIKHKGSAGGHNGLKSIIQELGTGDFVRLRVGIATDIHKGDISGYVLSPFRKKDRKHVEHVVAMAKEAVLCWMKNGVEKAMTKYNTKSVGTS